jgi:hypothetical protein
MTVKDLAPLDLDPDLDAWERQPGETVKRHGQFAVYRDLGRVRTLTKVAETLTLNAGYVRQVSAAMRWVERAEAWDRHRDALAQAQWLEERRKAAENDARLLGAAVGKIAGRLQALRADELSVGDLVRLLDVTLRHRRALFGDPQMTVAVTGPGGDPLTVQLAEFSQMGAEQRRLAIEDMVAAVRRRVDAAAGIDDDDE